MSPAAFVRSIPGRFPRLVEHGRYRPAVDGLRFVAIAFVLAGHLMERTARTVAAGGPLDRVDAWTAFLIPQATTGVLLFFTISGYILGLQYVRQQAKGGRFRYGEYLLRRAARIFPPYYVVLLLDLGASLVIGQRTGLTGNVNPAMLGAVSDMFSFLFLHGVVLGAMPTIFPPGWSLEVEVHFYLIAPVLFAIMCRPPQTGARASYWQVLAASVLLLGLSMALFGAIANYYFSLLRYLPFFVLGPCLALLVGRDERSRPGPLAADAAGGVGLAALALSGMAQHVATGWFQVIGLDLFRLAAIAGLFVGIDAGRAFPALFSRRWIGFLGSACFSIYLCHLQVMQLLTPLTMRFLAGQSLVVVYAGNLAIQIPVVLAAGIAFYIVVERPFMRPDLVNLLVRRPRAEMKA